jgi:hypothetical protein
LAPALAGAGAGAPTQAVAAAAAPRAGTVFTTEGGRVKGTILDAGPAGVSVQLADGSTRNMPAAQVTRVDFADGTSWTPGAAQAQAPAAQNAAAAAPAAAAGAAPAAVTVVPAATRASPIVLPVDRLDSVYLANGGRVRGLVVEEIPAEGIVMRLIDGTERRYRPGETVLVQYADGTTSPPAAAQPKQAK